MMNITKRIKEWLFPKPRVRFYSGGRKVEYYERK